METIPKMKGSDQAVNRTTSYRLAQGKSGLTDKGLGLGLGPSL